MMSMVAPLYRELLAVCSSGVIPNLKLTSALQNCHATKKIYHNSEDVGVWAPTAGGKLRMIAQKWRTWLKIRMLSIDASRRHATEPI